MKLSDLLSSIYALEIVGETQKEISALCFDTRQVVANSLFVAQEGTEVDGHGFIGQAIAAGATAIVLSKKEYISLENQDITFILVENTHAALGLLSSCWFGNPSQKLTLVGVTGTNGKTTIATLLYHLTEEMGFKAGLLSTVENFVHTERYAATHTTPDALTINELLAKMVAAGCQYAFMEVSSHALDQQRVEGLHYTGAIFTNLTRDHIDYHKTFDNYRDAKKKLFDNLCSDAFAIINKDDKNGAVMVQNTKARVYTYSTQEVADFRAKIVEMGFYGMKLDVDNQEVFVSLVGRFNVSNLLAIYGTAVALGFEKKEILRVLSTLKPVNGRFDIIASPRGWVAIVDYAHTPDALENVLKAINDVRSHNPENGSKLICLVGCGGNRDKGKRPIMAQIAFQNSDQVILTSDNPRNEEPMDILNDMLAGLSQNEQKKIVVQSDRKMAIQTACLMAQKNDVILVAGKGHEDYQIVKGEKHHFDDHEVVKQFLDT